MTVFEVYEPIEIPFTSTNNVKRINRDNTNEFLRNLVEEGIDKKQGCYIFCLRTGRGYSPWYVGKATKGIHQECMQDGKIRRYNEVLHDGKKGTPVMFFLLPGQRKNKAPTNTINEMEKFLIKAGYERNKDIMNTHHAKDDTWTIKGVSGKSGSGQSKKEERDFKTMLKL
ncbi:MAG: hypothetical protein OXE42_02375 [Gammaproteobacteria bacterium]|nr:hypothetical protein [Gammaproteobacteria bacterium]